MRRHLKLAAAIGALVTIPSYFVVGCSGDDSSGTAPDAGAADATADQQVTADGSSDSAAHTDTGTSETGSDAGTEDGSDAGQASPLSHVGHVVVIYLENHSFDNLLGSWPGADGLANAGVTQVGADGGPYGTLPQYAPYPSSVESLSTSTIANAPFDLTGYFQENAFTNDLLHRFYQEQRQINGGKMDSYVLWNDESAGQSMGYWPTSSLPMPQWMQAHSANVTVCDHFFHAAFGGSFLNHFWLIAAQSPSYPNFPTDAGLAATVDSNGQLDGVLDTTSIPPSEVINSGADDGQLTPDGFVVNTSYSVNEPHPTKYDQPGAKTYQLVPQQTFTTIGDELDTAGVKWAWYAGGWNAALAGAGLSSIETDAGVGEVPDAAGIGAYAFEYHHQPFVYFANWGGTANNGGVGTNPPNGRWATNHNLQDEQDFIAAAAAGTLPPVSFVKPLYDEHPNYTTETDSENHTVELLNDIVSSPTWSDTVVIITYDENGGAADHVPPPTTDKWGPGTRVPGIVISPFAKGGVDSTVYDTTAILKLIENRWGLPALSTRDAAQNDLSVHALTLP